MRPSHALSANDGGVCPKAFHALAPKLDAQLRVISSVAAPNDHVKAAGEVRDVFSLLFSSSFLFCLGPGSEVSFLAWSFGMVQIQKLEALIDEAVLKIQKVELQIEGTETELKLTQDPKQQDYLRAKEQQLRAKELKLRDELKPLRAQLDDELKPLRAKQQALLEEQTKYPAGNEPFPSGFKVGFDAALWSSMSQETQQRVKVLLQDQAALAAVKVFSQMRSDMGVEEAEALDITVVHSSEGKVELGVFDVPAVTVTMPPKGACERDMIDII